MEYVRSHGSDLEFFNWENVLSLSFKPMDGEKTAAVGPSSLDSVVFILREKAGMFTHTWKLDPFKCMGVPQSRARIWGTSMFIDGLNMTEDEATDILNAVMNSIVGITPCNIEEYLLPESDPLIVDHIRAVAVKVQDEAEGMTMHNLLTTGGMVPGAKRRKAEPKQQGDFRWPDQHDAAFQKLGEDLNI